MQRSLEYYRSDAGKIKKQNLNARRSQSHHVAESAPTENRFGGQQDHEAAEIVRHLQVVTRLIEARRVALQEIMALVTEILRQLRIGKAPKRGYHGCDADNRSP
jgi:hypothetical protein